MNRRPTPQGFTRKELFVALAVVAIHIFCLVNYFVVTSSGIRPRVKTNSAATRARSIHTILTTWAQDHNQEYPTARQFSNEAFRELFKAGLIVDGSGEEIFAIPGDAWHNNSPAGKGPDGIIGPAPNFPLALTRGECAWAYVSGLDTASNGSLPLLANGFTESLGVYTADKFRKGGVFQGTKIVWVTVAGSAKSYDLSGDFRLLEKKGGKAMDVFSKEWGTNPDDIKNPEG